MSLAENIKTIRKSRNKTQKELADLIGVKYQTIQKYENGVIANIPYDTLVKLSDALMVSPADILGWNNEAIDYAQGAFDAELLSKYHALNETHRSMILQQIDLFLDMENKR